MMRALSGGIKSELRAGALLAIRLPVPPLSAQETLVDRLGTLQSRIETVRDVTGMSGGARGVLSGYLDELFGDPYDARRGRLDADRWVPLSDLVDDVADGPHETPVYREDGIPFITALNVAPGKLILAPAKYVSVEDHRSFQKRARAERGDVLVTKDGTIGLSCAVDTDVEFSFFVSVALIKPRRAVLDGQFLLWLLRAPATQRRIAERARGDMIRHLVLREIRALLCPVLTIASQRAAVQEVERVAQLSNAASAAGAEVSRQVERLLPRVLNEVFPEA